MSDDGQKSFGSYDWWKIVITPFFSRTTQKHWSLAAAHDAQLIAAIGKQHFERGRSRYTHTIQPNLIDLFAVCTRTRVRAVRLCLHATGIEKAYMRERFRNQSLIARPLCVRFRNVYYIDYAASSRVYAKVSNFDIIFSRNTRNCKISLETKISTFLERFIVS